MASTPNDPFATSGSLAPPSTPTSPEKKLWIKMDARTYRARGLKDDPVRTWVLDNLYPVYLDAIRNKTFNGSRERYAGGVLLKKFEETWDFEGKGYNMGDFKNKLFLILKNHYDTTDNPSRNVKIEAAIPTAKKPRAVNGLDIYRRTHGPAITERTTAELDAAKATGDAISRGQQLAICNSTSRKMYESCDVAVRNEMEDAARLENERIAAGPTETDIIRNQETVHLAVMKQLKSVMGHTWGGHGDMAFFVRAAFKNAAGQTATFCLSLGPKQSVEPYSSMQENEEVANFNSWAARILHSGTADDIAPVPVVEVHETGDMRVPSLDVDKTHADVLRRLLKEYAAATTMGFHGQTVALEIPGQLKIDLEKANSDQLRDFYELLLQAQITGEQTTEIRADHHESTSIECEANPANSASAVTSALVNVTMDPAGNALLVNTLPTTPPPLHLPTTSPPAAGSPTLELPVRGPAADQPPVDPPAPSPTVVIPSPSLSENARASGAQPPVPLPIVNPRVTPAPVTGPLVTQPPIVGLCPAPPQPALSPPVVTPIDKPADSPVMPLSDLPTNTLAPNANHHADQGVSEQVKRGRKRGADPSTASKRAAKIHWSEDPPKARRSSRNKDNKKLNQQPTPAQGRIIRSGRGWYEEEIW